MKDSIVFLRKSTKFVESQLDQVGVAVSAPIDFIFGTRGVQG